MTQIEMYDGDLIAEYEDSPELRAKIFDAIIKFCKDHNASTGEAMQNDDFAIDAAPFLCDLIDDILQFKTHWK